MQQWVQIHLPIISLQKCIISGEERLEALTFMQAFRDELPDTETVIDTFAAKRLRKVDFVL